MGLSRTVSEINGDFCRKSQFFASRVFISPAKGVTLEIVHRRRGRKTRMMGLPEGRKRFKLGSTFDTIPACDRHPASQPRCRSKDKAMLCVARVKIQAVLA